MVETTTVTVLATGHGMPFSEGTCRIEYRVLADGTLERGYASQRGGWIAPTEWRAMTQKEVVAMANSTMSEGDVWAGWAPEVKDAVRAKYGMRTGPAYPCKGKRDGCGRKVSRPNTYCSQCEHDA